LSARWLERREEERNGGGERRYLCVLEGFAKEWVLCGGAGLA